MTTPYRLFGVESSPYTVKMRAAFRYRRLPYRWICCFPQMFEETREVQPALMPVVQFPDGSYRVDSTPMLLALEADHPEQRSLLPDDPAHGFAARVIEDLADEWIAKCLFRYRFSFEDTGWFAARWVMSDAHRGTGDAANRSEAVASFRDRQVGRKGRVGVTPGNAAVLEATYRRLLGILEAFVGNGCFLFGSRPSLADLALYAQLKTLATDPSGQAVIRDIAPYTEHWVRRLDDASGVDGEWDPGSLDEGRPAWALLQMAGEFYFPFLEANTRALGAGEESLRIELGPGAYEQGPFGYQHKCLLALREAWRALPAESRERLHPGLDAARCLSPLEGAS